MAIHHGNTHVIDKCGCLLEKDDKSGGKCKIKAVGSNTMYGVNLFDGWDTQHLKWVF